MLLLPLLLCAALNDNKALIVQLGGLKPLVDLLQQGDPSAMKDAGSAINRLQQNKATAVDHGAVKALMGNIKERVHVSKMLATLSLRTGIHTAADELVNLDAVGCLLSIIRDNGSEASRENCSAILHDLCKFSRSARKDLWDDEKVKRNNFEAGTEWNSKGKKEG